MRAWLLYAWLRCAPWWLFRLVGPSDVLVLDWRLARWGRAASWAPVPAPPFVVDLEHVCRPQWCSCVGELVVPGARIG